MGLMLEELGYDQRAVVHIYLFSVPNYLILHNKNCLFCFRESEDGVDLSLFEALREGIYSEVATLISQNENRPHFLIELFRELQKLNTDYLRQRALYAIRDVGSKYLNEQNPEVKFYL